MCEFCLKHGEGEKWCLEVSNYAEDLLSELGRRKLFKAAECRPRFIISP